jgi:hypothetical protein
LRRAIAFAAPLALLLLITSSALGAVRVVHGPAVPPDPSTVPAGTIMIGGPLGSGKGIQTPAAPTVRPRGGPQRVGYMTPASKAKRAVTNSQMLYHGGATMLQAKNYLFFWEPPRLQNGASASVPSNYNAMMARYFLDIGGSGLYNLATQYYWDYQGLRYHIQNSTQYGGYVIDRSGYPRGCTSPLTGVNCMSDSQLQAEVRKLLAYTHLTPTVYNEFFLYTSKGEGNCFNSSDCFGPHYCAYHTYGSYNGNRFIYGNMPYAATANGCLTRAGSQVLAPNGNSAIDAELNITSHEQIESVTDPFLDAWYGPGGVSDEIGDKCAFNLGTRRYLGGQANQLLKGHYYILQTEWNNARFGCTSTGP